MCGAAAPPEHLRGCIDGLLDNPERGLGVARTTPDGAVTLASRTCVGPSQKRDDEYLLSGTGRVKEVIRDCSADGESETSAPTPETLEEVHALPE